MARAAGSVDVVFMANAQAGPPAQIVPLSGNDQIAGVRETLSQVLRARVADALGNPITGATVTFNVIAGEEHRKRRCAYELGRYRRTGRWTLGPGSGAQGERNRVPHAWFFARVRIRLGHWRSPGQRHWLPVGNVTGGPFGEPSVASFRPWLRRLSAQQQRFAHEDLKTGSFTFNGLTGTVDNPVPRHASVELWSSRDASLR
jgi:hypothetical protein